MTAQQGALVLIKIGDGNNPEVFTTIGGLRTSGIFLNNQPLDSSNVETGVWRQLLSAAGASSVKISGSGIFTDAASEETMRSYSFAGTVNNYQFIFANGDCVSGPFLIASYSREGDIENEETYAMALESAGNIAFSSA